MNPRILTKQLFALSAIYLSALTCNAQTDVDAIMMNKNLFCLGAVYGHSSWKSYWEGEFKRDNENLGTVSSQTYSLMGSYGLSNKLNLLFNLPYMQTKATAGTLHGMKGLQDLSLMLKWMPYLKHVGNNGIVSAYLIGGVTTPLSNYAADFQPLSLGMHSTNLTLRGMVDFQQDHFFTTASISYAYRSNVTIDRNAYYTTQMYYTNSVRMPDVGGYNIRAGYRSNSWVAEGVVENMTTFGGFDIRKNDMPFPSNKMNATMAGVNFKYSFMSVPGLELTAGAKYTVAGRNVGQATMFDGGIFYILNFSKRTAEEKINTNSKTTQL